MKTLSIFVTLLSLVAFVGCNTRVEPPKVNPLPPAAPPAPAAVTVESIDGGFKVAFPSQPVRKADKTKNGKPSENYVLQTRENALIIGFSYPTVPLPPGQLNEKAIDAGLDGAVENYVRESKGMLRSKEQFLMGEIRGMNFRSNITGKQPGDSAEVKGSVFWLDGRLVRMLAIGSSNWLQSKQVNDYFDSFSVLNTK